MLGTIAKAIFGSANDRYVKSLDRTIATINALEPQIQALSDAELQAQTQKFRDQLAAGSTLRKAGGVGVDSGAGTKFAAGILIVLVGGCLAVIGQLLTLFGGRRGPAHQG